MNSLEPPEYLAILPFNKKSFVGFPYRPTATVRSKLGVRAEEIPSKAQRPTGNDVRSITILLLGKMMAMATERR
jgi:hypothetical protein